MSEAIAVALLTGGMSLLGVIITCSATARKTEKLQAVTQAVTETKLDELTREVRAHNGFAQRLPVVENELKSLNRRVNTLEQRQLRVES